MAKKKSSHRPAETNKDQGPALPEEVVGPAATAELPFSEMISRWLDDGDRLHETPHPASEYSAEVGGHPGRLGSFIENARARVHQHRRLVGGAALLGVIALVAAFRHAHSTQALATGVTAIVAEAPATTTTATTTTTTTTATTAPVAVTPAAVPVAANVPAKGAPDPAAPAAALPAAAPSQEVTANAPPAPGPQATTSAAAATAGSARVAAGTTTTEIAVASSAAPATAPAAPVAKAEPVPPSPRPVSAPSSETAAPRHDDERVAPVVAGAPAGLRKARPTELATGAPSSAPPLELCKSALIRQRSRDALAACRQVFGGDPHSADAMVLLARADLLAGRPAETLELARRAVATNPRQADAYLLIGTIEQTTGQRQEARTAYETYLQLSPYGAHASDVRAILRTL